MCGGAALHPSGLPSSPGRSPAGPPETPPRSLQLLGSTSPVPDGGRAWPAFPRSPGGGCGGAGASPLPLPLPLATSASPPLCPAAGRGRSSLEPCAPSAFATRTAARVASVKMEPDPRVPGASGHARALGLEPDPLSHEQGLDGMGARSCVPPRSLCPLQSVGEGMLGPAVPRVFSSLPPSPQVECHQCSFSFKRFWSRESVSCAARPPAP